MLWTVTQGFPRPPKDLGPCPSFYTRNWNLDRVCPTLCASLESLGTEARPGQGVCSQAHGVVPSLHGQVPSSPPEAHGSEGPSRSPARAVHPPLGFPQSQGQAAGQCWENGFADAHRRIKSRARGQRQESISNQ